MKTQTRISRLSRKDRRREFRRKWYRNYRPYVEPLEERVMLASDGLEPLYAVGADAGGGPHVRAWNPLRNQEILNLFVYSPEFRGGVRVATGDVNGDRVRDVITGAGAGGGPHVKVFDGATGAEIRSFMAYDIAFTGGVHVGTGDVNGDEITDIITGAGAGGGPHVKVFDGATGAVIHNFMAYDIAFTGGVHVGAGDVNGGGVADIITGAGAGGGPHVKVFDGAIGAETRSFMAYDIAFTGGVWVAGGRVNDDEISDIITGAGARGGPHVKVFDGVTGGELHNFYAYDPHFAGGARVAGSDVNDDGFADIVTGAGPGGGPHVRAVSGRDTTLFEEFYAFDPMFRGGVHVGSGEVNNIVDPPHDTNPPEYPESSTDDDAPTLSAMLVRDTAPNGVTNNDGITCDPTITGIVQDESAIVAFRAGFDDTPVNEFVDIFGELQSGGGFTLEPESLSQIKGGLLGDQTYVLHLQAEDEHGNISEVFDVTFTLKTSGPTVVILQPANGSVVAENTTIFGVVDDLYLSDVRLQAQVDNGPFEDVAVDTNGDFGFTTSFMLDGSDDGEHRIRFQATCIAGKNSEFADVSLIVDTVPLTVEFHVDPLYDTEAIGDLVTSKNPVVLLGQTTPYANVLLETTGATTVADEFGRFVLPNVALTLGDNSLTVRATDARGLSSSAQQTVTLIAPCAFEDGLADWTVAEIGGSTTGFGDVTGEDCTAILREGNSFDVTLSQTFIVAEHAQNLRFSFDDLLFDTTDTFINDAFEVALLDDSGNSLAATISPALDSLFNVTEGGAPALGDSTIINGQTVTLDLSGVFPGTLATLVFRLVNNDSDEESTVRITDVRIPSVNDPLNATKFFVVDAAADQVFRYDRIGGDNGSFTVDPFASQSRGITSNAEGDTLWIIDANTHRVAVQGPDGTQRAAWHPLGLNNPQGIATDGVDLWIVDAGSHQVLRFVGGAARTFGEFGASATFDLHADNTSPTGIATDGSTLWVSDDVRDEVFVYDVAGTLLGRWQLDADNADPSGITNDAVGGPDLWIVDRVDRAVYQYTAGTAHRAGIQFAVADFLLATANTNPEGIADPPPQSADGDSLLDESGTVTFTTTEDFELGTLFNSNSVDVAGEVRLNNELTDYHYIWIANSGEGTLSKLDTRTGEELARYRTGPESLGGDLSPSRTAVDNDGNVWVTNRAYTLQASMVKVLDRSFVDRNGNGVVDTSEDLNGDGRITGIELLPWDANGDGQPDDERIALVVQVGRNRDIPSVLRPGGTARPVVTDFNGDVWVGLTSFGQYEVYDGVTGEIKAIVPTAFGPYNAVIDNQGTLWSVGSAGTDPGRLDRIDTLTRSYVETVSFGDTGDRIYGITLDPDNVLWMARFGVGTSQSGGVIRYDPSTGDINHYIVGGTEYRGVAVDRDRNIWLARSYTSYFMRKLTFADDHRTLLEDTPLFFSNGQVTAEHATIAAVDSDGFIWTTDFSDNVAYKIDPTTNEVVPTWPVPTGDSPHEIADDPDPTGITRLTVSERIGFWNEIIDSRQTASTWAVVSADTDEPPGTYVQIRVRASDQRSALESLAWMDVVENQPLQGVNGRYLQIEAKLKSDNRNVTPSLKSLAVATASPPTVSVRYPDDGVELEAGHTVVLTGTASTNLRLPDSAVTNRITQLTVDGIEADALDPSGNFFHKVTARPGQNEFVVTATDAFGQTATTTLTLIGTQYPPGEVNFSRLLDVSQSFKSNYERTSFYEDQNLLFADLFIRNTGQYTADAPLLVGFSNISDPAVQLQNPDGFMPDGTPYYDYSGQIGGNTLSVGEATGARTLQFFNPNRVQFSYDLIVLSKPNESPQIITVPNLFAQPGGNYRYDVGAIDPDDDIVMFSLLGGPAAMTIDQASGEISWTPTAGDLGTHIVAIRVSDGRGGTVEQRFVLTVDEQQHRPPVLLSTPPVLAAVQVPYFYPVGAFDADDDVLTYSLGEKPEGMTINPTNGVIEWTPQVDQIGLQAITLIVSDTNGATAKQTFTLNVIPEPSNHAPIFVSEPITRVVDKTTYVYTANALDPDEDDVTYSLVSGPAGMAIDENTGRIAWESYPPNGGGIKLANDLVALPNTVLNGLADMTIEFWMKTVNADERAVLSGARSGNDNELLIWLSSPNTLSFTDGSWTTPIPYNDNEWHHFAFVRDASNNQLTLYFDGIAQLTHNIALGPLTIDPNGLLIGQEQDTVGGGFQGSQAFHGELDEFRIWNIARRESDILATMHRTVPGTESGLAGYWRFDEGGGVTALDQTPNQYDGQLGSGSFLPTWVSPKAPILPPPKVTVRASDENGEFADQTFDLDFSIPAPNSPPVITSVAPAQATVGLSFVYDTSAVDPDGDFVHFELTDAPQGMLIDTETGRITWIPVEEQIGAQTITVRASDRRGGIDTQLFDVEVVASRVNSVPQIVSNPITFGDPSQLYRYDVVATDSDADLLTFDLPVHPIGMIIDPQDGAIVWEPGADQIGVHDVIVRVRDGQGGVDLQPFQIVISANTAPVIVTDPPHRATADRPHEYLVQAQDAENDNLTYSLTNAPSEMTIDTDSGLLQWSVPFPENSYLHFDGLDDYIEIPNSSSLHSDREITISGWFNVSGFPTEWQSLIRKGNSPDASEPGQSDREYGLWINQDGYLLFTSTPNSRIGVGQLFIQTKNIILPRQWYHFAAVIDSDENYMRIFVNGELAAEGVYDASGIRETNGRLTFGHAPTWDNHLYGALDEIQIWNHARSQDEIRSDMDRRITGGAGLMGYWHFDELTGNIAVDQSGNQNDGVLGAGMAVQEPTRMEFGLDFDGSNDLVSLPYSVLDGLSDMTTEFWLRLPHGAGDQGVISGANSSNSNEFYVYLPTTASLKFHTGESISSGVTWNFSPIDDNRWHHVALVRDDLNDQVSLYLDGISQGALSSPLNPLSIAEGGLFLGQDQDAVGGGFGNDFDGDLYDLRIWNRLRTETEIQNDMTRSLTGDELGLVGYWPMDEGSGDVIHDLTASTYDGLLGAGIDVLAPKWNASPMIGDLHSITIRVEDDRGLFDTQSYQLEVNKLNPNQPPIITSLPRTTIRFGDDYLYDVHASDADFDPLTYSFENNPLGMTINFAGRVSWHPTSQQIGEHLVTIRVDDGLGGFTTQTFTVSVLTNDINDPPRILSTPKTVAAVGGQFRHQLTAVDPNNDVLNWSLVEGPAGMSLSADGGLLVWTPKTGDVGLHTVRVRVADPFDRIATQFFTIAVHSTNSPPVITSTPPTRVSVGDSHYYAVRAVDADGDEFTYSLVAGPDAMTIDGNTGFIRWRPALADVGPHEITVRVDDNRGGIAEQTYMLDVVASAPNSIPVITSTPSLIVRADAVYEYQIVASDADSDPLTFQFLDTPPSGMTINADTGFLEWTPTESQIGDHRISVAAVDPTGAGSSQSYTLHVRSANQTPIITSISVTDVTASDLYQYDVQASDPDNDSLSYALINGPTGITIDDLGRMIWSPAIADIGIHPIEIEVRDEYGATASQTFDLIVMADTEAPSVEMLITSGPVPIDTPIRIKVLATDNIGVVDRTLTIDGNIIPLDATGLAFIPFDIVGTHQIVAAARDAAGNVATVEREMLVVDPSIVGAPTTIISSPDEYGIVTAPTEIIGTVEDIDLLLYTLSFAPTSGGDFVEFARGTESISDGVLGHFDPTVLSNDSYTLRLTATDAGGNTSTVDRTIEVTGNLKIGNFSVSFVDMTIPISGIPIQLIRTYDSFEANRNTDIGYGWNVAFRDTNLRTTVPKTGDEAFGVYQPYRAGDRVYLNVPGEGRQAFTFQPYSVILFGGIQRFFPRFVADPGTYSTLTAGDFQLIPKHDGFHIVGTGADGLGGLAGFGSFGSGGAAYNPADPLLDLQFTLTTKDGVVYDIDPKTGDMITVSDRSGNQLTFYQDGIESNRGKRIDFERNAQGRITKIIDPAGNSVKFTYDQRGDLVAVTDREGNTTRFLYASKPAHFLKEIIDPLGRTGIRSEYDDQGRLIKMFDAQGNPIEMVHDLENSVETVFDQRGIPTTFEYDNVGNVVRQIDAEGGITEYAYDDPNHPYLETAVTVFDGVHPEGNTTLLTYDTLGHVLSETNALGNTTRYRYGRFGNYLTITSALGNTIVNNYDLRGNRITTRDASGNSVIQNEYDETGILISATDALGMTVEFDHDEYGNTTRSVSPLGLTLSYTYDANGVQLSQSSGRTNDLGDFIELTFNVDVDREGNVTSAEGADGSSLYFEYDSLGNQVGIVNATGDPTVYEYDASGNRVATTFPDGSKERFNYDATGNLLSVTDRLGRVTHYTYDGIGRQIRTTFPDGSTKGTEYDTAGHISSVTDENGNTTKFEYDKAGNQIGVIDALGNITQSYYDAESKLIAIADAAGNRTEFKYDANGRRTKIIFPDGSQQVTQYDTAGNVTAATDGNGNTTRFTYNILGRLVEVNDALGNTTKYSYDEFNNITAITDANGGAVKFTPDNAGRVVKRTMPLGMSENYVYNENGLLSYVKDYNGEDVFYEYDTNGNISRKIYSDNTAIQYSYNAEGQLSSVTDSNGTTSYEYDARDRLTLQINPDGTSISYTYDLVGNVTSIATLSGTTHYEYDALNRLTTVTDPDDAATRYQYDQVGNIVETQYPNRTVEHRQYDLVGRLIVVEVVDGVDNSIFKEEYTYDGVGNRTIVEELSGRRVEFAYDPLSRLVGERYFENGDDLPTRVIEYTYDAVGNRISRNDTLGGETIYEYDANDRLAKETTGAIEIMYHYDQEGNLVSKNDNAEDTVAYQWNVDDRLTGIDTNGDGANEVVYVYSHDGNRISERIDGTEIHFLVDSNRQYAQVLDEYGTTQELVTSYVYGHDLISADHQGETYFYHSDAIGSTRVLTDATGNVTDSYSYDAFGDVIDSQGPTANRYLFAGEQFAAPFNSYYLRARYYTPTGGRFLSRDPLDGDPLQPWTMHDYAYAGNNPVNWIDPSGAFSVAAVLGAAGLQLVVGVGAVVFTAITVHASLPEDKFQSDPDAGLLGVSASLDVGGGKVFGLLSGGPLAGLELLFPAQWSGAWAYFYVGLGIGVGFDVLEKPTKSGKIGLSGYAGFVWQANTPSSYTGWFVSYSVSTLIPSFPTLSVGANLFATPLDKTSGYGFSFSLSGGSKISFSGSWTYYVFLGSLGSELTKEDIIEKDPELKKKLLPWFNL